MSRLKAGKTDKELLSNSRGDFGQGWQQVGVGFWVCFEGIVHRMCQWIDKMWSFRETPRWLPRFRPKWTVSLPFIEIGQMEEGVGLWGKIRKRYMFSARETFWTPPGGARKAVGYVCGVLRTGPDLGVVRSGSPRHAAGGGEVPGRSLWAGDQQQEQRETVISWEPSWGRTVCPAVPHVSASSGKLRAAIWPLD